MASSLSSTAASVYRRPGLLVPSVSLCRREIVRFLRQPGRVIGALASPLMFWLFIGSGVGTSFQPPGAPTDLPFLAFLHPGILTMVVLFTAIFSTISIIEDRQAGFLQGVLVAPVGRSAIVFGKLLGGAVLATLQATLLLPLLWLAGVWPPLLHLLCAMAVMFLLGLGLTGLGFVLAWRMDSTQGFHAVMMTFLLPLWMLSGAFFAPSGAMGWVQVAMMLNPMTWGVDLLRALLSPGVAPALPWMASLGLLSAFTVGMMLVCLRTAQR